VRLDAKRAIRKRLGAPRASSGARSEGIGEAEVARLLYCDAATLPNDGRHCRLEGGWSAGNFALRAHPQVYPFRAQGSATGAALASSVDPPELQTTPPPEFDGPGGAVL